MRKIKIVIAGHVAYAYKYINNPELCEYLWEEEIIEDMPEIAADRIIKDMTDFSSRHPEIAKIKFNYRNNNGIITIYANISYYFNY